MLNKYKRAGHAMWLCGWSYLIQTGEVKAMFSFEEQAA